MGGEGLKTRVWGDVAPLTYFFSEFQYKIEYISKIKNRKIDFLFVSAYCVSFIKIWPLMKENNLFCRLLRSQHLKIVNKIDHNSKNMYRKIYFSFFSAQWASFMQIWPLLRGEGLHILSWEKSFFISK